MHEAPSLYTHPEGLVKDTEKFSFLSPGQKNYVLALFAAIQDHYKDRLMTLAVFGSYAAKTPRYNSDLDLLLILNEKKQSISQKIAEFTKLELTLTELEEKCWQSGVCMEISPLILNQNSATSFHPIYLDMVTSHLIIIDKNDFLKNILKNVQGKMKKWGSKKINESGSWIWQIKPDLKWGEKIDYDE